MTIRQITSFVSFEIYELIFKRSTIKLVEKVGGNFEELPLSE
ncbi:hypothetical protein [Bacillus sp. AFS041924]|nr:hypothetical protein [Bacillus sp. AFS041924]